MSPQGFSQAWFDDFVALMKREPAWLTGVVHGPGTRVRHAELRAALPARYLIRDYPDITHSRTCQYTVPDWDVAFSLTLAREGCNPRPVQTSQIFRYARPHTS